MTADGFRKLFTRNTGLKLLSLALAFTVWSISAVSRTTTLRYALPLRLANIPRGYSARETPPAGIDLTLTGPRHLLSVARRSTAAITLDLTGVAAPGTTSFTHLESYLELPEGVRITRISPASLNISLEAEHSPQGDKRQ